MKLVTFFVPGNVANAVAVVNDLRIVYEFTNMTQQTYVIADRTTPLVDPLITSGFNVFCKMTDLREKWLIHQLKLKGIIKE